MSDASNQRSCPEDKKIGRFRSDFQRGGGRVAVKEGVVESKSWKIEDQMSEATY